jgi:hypothetical protein
VAEKADFWLQNHVHNTNGYLPLSCSFSTWGSFTENKVSGEWSWSPQLVSGLTVHGVLPPYPLFALILFIYGLFDYTVSSSHKNVTNKIIINEQWIGKNAGSGCGLISGTIAAFAKKDWWKLWKTLVKTLLSHSLWYIYVYSMWCLGRWITLLL